MLIIRRPSVKYATIANQVAMLGNILLGIVILPFIAANFGEQVLVSYIKIYAAKAVVDIFTSALGGGFVREMLERGIYSGFILSRRFFAVYSALVLAASMAGNYYVFEYKCIEIAAIIVFFCFSLLQQPWLQKLSAMGYQQVPAILRLVNSLGVFFSVIILGSVSTEKQFEELLVVLAGWAVVCMGLAILVGRICEPSSNAECGISNWIVFLKKNIVGYSAFAGLMAFCFSQEAVFLESKIGAGLFIVAVVGWKVPNIAVQFLWRYSEVSGLDLKRRNTSLSKKELAVIMRRIERNVAKLGVGIALLYLIFAKYGYMLWMGQAFSKQIDAEVIFLFSAGIVILSQNRAYTAFLQYFKAVKWVALQYFIIVLVKLVVIFMWSEQLFYISFIFWFALELVFLMINRRLMHGVLSEA